MAQQLSDDTFDTPIFVDANLFAYHHSSHPRFGDGSTDFLKRIESRRIRAVTSNVVQQEVMYFLQMQRGESLLGTRDRSQIHAHIAADPDFSKGSDADQTVGRSPHT